LAGGHFVDHCLQIRPVAGDEDCDADWGGHCGRLCWVIALDRRFVGFAVDFVEVGGPAVARTERRFFQLELDFAAALGSFEFCGE
jgi:hypothetical protein